jgi:hypothetical protein
MGNMAHYLPICAILSILAAIAGRPGRNLRVLALKRFNAGGRACLKGRGFPAP